MPKNNLIKIFDTYTRQKRSFVSQEHGIAKIYTCGPTVYDFAHIGNFRAYIFSDTLRRVLEFNGYKVKHVINITDVGHLTSDEDSGEDKIEASARRQKKSAKEIADFYTNIFMDGFKSLNLKEPFIWSKATDHIPEQIALIKKLEAKGFTYQASDGIYFDTAKLKNYGHLSRLDLKGLKRGARVDFNDEKKSLTDFALWKFSPKDQKRQMEWESPWGIGFPGWHIECSAMAMKYLGETIDIHTGGIDHIPVHHTNEIAQSETVTGKQFAKYWMHVAFLTVDGQKMAKSQGNFTTLKDITKKGYDPLSFKYLALTSNYRSSFNFTWNNLASAQKSLTSIRDKINNLGPKAKNYDEKIIKKLKGCVNNDINTPQALALLWETLENKKIANNSKKTTLLEFDKVFGLDLNRKEIVQIPDTVKKLVESREQARKDKKWNESDNLRKEIEKIGYSVEDTTSGPKLKKIPL